MHRGRLSFNLMSFFPELARQLSVLPAKVVDIGGAVPEAVMGEQSYYERNLIEELEDFCFSQIRAPQGTASTNRPTHKLGFLMDNRFQWLLR